MKVLVCGGRDYDHQKTVNTVLVALHLKTPITEIIEGGARGADTCGKEFARMAGIKCTTVPADWTKYGRAAGWHRNSAMADLKPDLVVAFRGGKGTAMMVKIANERGIEVKEIK